MDLNIDNCLRGHNGVGLVLYGKLDLTLTPVQDLFKGAGRT
ncbi:hypothetical protein RAB80_014110 [Fusarium oxysporum f. sp. vasinfectum]|uniref:Uncharacterized protein n=2 Tax=Fusarium oxysporum TaxID=5507 RepID=X0KXH7_FUSOX|nr:hypothetical protein FOVG_18785 [Fusarium oxysporum f. sp. pisi HDV247]EXM13497.1 hypothetical protein FOTG_18045 [Fusarium oxysporum f. sp. vasinfectum 25433]KAK2669973.1 hypothetical protein RAB80_014110 [Fusarium oxysporum f. sp. vasinfectum]